MLSTKAQGVLRGACAFVQSRRVTQSFGVDEESRHLRTPTN